LTDLATLKELREPGGNALFTADDTDEEWGIAHRILLPAFSRSNMEKYATQMGAVALKLVECLSKRSRKEEIDILEVRPRSPHVSQVLKLTLRMFSDAQENDIRYYRAMFVKIEIRSPGTHG
jgi:hypothetical protein